MPYFEDHLTHFLLEYFDNFCILGILISFLELFGHFYFWPLLVVFKNFNGLDVKLNVLHANVICECLLRLYTLIYILCRQFPSAKYALKILVVLDSRTWTFGPSLKNKKSNAGCATFLNEDDIPTIVVGGGFYDFRLTEKTEFLIDGSTEWTGGPDLPRKTKDTSLVRLPNKQGLVMIGGMGSTAGKRVPGCRGFRSRLYHRHILT